jgi:hypothetical protein
MKLVLNDFDDQKLYVILQVFNSLGYFGNALFAVQSHKVHRSQACSDFICLDILDCLAMARLST